MINYGKFSDQHLLDLLKAGDQRAFTEIYDRYKEILYRYAYRWLQDRESVKDVIQELFTVVWTKHDVMVFNQNLSGYLYASVRNRILRKISQDKRAADYTESLRHYVTLGENITDYQIREKQLREIIEAEIANLPEKMREVFEMSRNNHFTHAEIAGKLKISEHTVRTHIKKALKILRGKLGMKFFIF